MHVGEVAIDVALVERLLGQRDAAHGPVDRGSTPAFSALARRTVERITRG